MPIGPGEIPAGSASVGCSSPHGLISDLDNRLSHTRVLSLFMQPELYDVTPRLVQISNEHAIVGVSVDMRLARDVSSQGPESPRYYDFAVRLRCRGQTCDVAHFTRFLLI